MYDTSSQRSHTSSRPNQANHLDLAKLINRKKERIKITATIPTRTQTSESISLIENTLKAIQKN